ncbi:hypothetical protein D3C87_1603310 [compost metagenome]
MFMPTQLGSASEAWAMPSRSRIETTSTSVVFLISAMNSLVIAGSEMRKACGRMIRPVAFQ